METLGREKKSTDLIMSHTDSEGNVNINAIADKVIKSKRQLKLVGAFSFFGLLLLIGVMIGSVV